MLNQDPNGGGYMTRDAWYSGYNIHATAGSRTVITEDLKPGYIVQLDPYDHDSTGKGRTVGKPTAGINSQLFVVIDVPSNVNDIVDTTTNRRRGGVIGISPCGVVQAFANAATNAVVINDKLSPYTANSFHLETSAGTTVAHLLARVSGTINQVRPCAVALEAKASGSGLIKVQFNGDGPA